MNQLPKLYIKICECMNFLSREEKLPMRLSNGFLNGPNESEGL